MSSPTLKKKIELNYRSGTRKKCCADCNHFGVLTVSQSAERAGILEHVKKQELRCEWIGIKPGSRYRINPNSICDKHDNSEHMKRLLRGSSFAKKGEV